MSAILAYMVWP